MHVSCGFGEGMFRYLDIFLSKVPNVYRISGSLFCAFVRLSQDPKMQPVGEISYIGGPGITSLVFADNVKYFKYYSFVRE